MDKCLLHLAFAASFAPADGYWKKSFWKDEPLGNIAVVKEKPWFLVNIETLTLWVHFHLRARCKRQRVKGEYDLRSWWKKQKAKLLDTFFMSADNYKALLRALIGSLNILILNEHIISPGLTTIEPGPSYMHLFLRECAFKGKMFRMEMSETRGEINSSCSERVTTANPSSGSFRWDRVTK